MYKGLEALRNAGLKNTENKLVAGGVEGFESSSSLGFGLRVPGSRLKSLTFSGSETFSELRKSQPIGVRAQNCLQDERHWLGTLELETHDLVNLHLRRLSS